MPSTLAPVSASKIKIGKTATRSEGTSLPLCIYPGLFTVFFLSESNNIYYKKPSIRALMRTCQQEPITRQHKHNAASDKPCVSHYPSTTEEHLLVQSPCVLQFLPLDLLLLPATVQATLRYLGIRYQNTKVKSQKKANDLIVAAAELRAKRGKFF